MEIVEVGIKLDRDFEYYDALLRSKGLVNDYKVRTHDIYYTNQDLNELSENQMKNACIRLRSCNDSNYKIQNNLINNKFRDKEVSATKLDQFEHKLFKLGYRKVFDTVKDDDVLKELKELDISNLTPIDAMNTLYQLQNKLKNRW